MPPDRKTQTTQFAERTSIVISDGKALHDLDVITSPTPLNAVDLPGWQIIQVRLGWLAVRLVA